jgi:hypothetical protein
VYEGQAPALQSGNYVATVAPRLGTQRLAPVIGGVSVASGIEYRQLRTDMPLLEEIARETGGRVLSLADPAGAELFNRAGLRPSIARTPLWRPLLLWTLLVLLLDVGTRRIAWDRFVSREFGADLRKAAREAVHDRGRQAARTVTALKGTAARMPEPASGPTLSDEDARRVAEQEAERRRKARLAAVQAAREAQRELGQEPTSEATSAPRRPAPIERPAAAAPEPVQPGTEGLLAAKRRARERLEGDGESSGT